MQSRPIVAVTIALAIFFVALTLRTSNAPSAFAGGLPLLPPNDDLYHAKRILYTLDHYPAILQFDSDRNVTGAFCPWPPLWDFAAATLAKATGRRGIDALTVASWIEPLATSLFIGLLALMVASRSGWAAGVVAGLGMAVPMPLIFVSQLARLDHHFLEGPLVLGVALAAATLAAKGGTAKHAAWLALAIAAALFVQTALLLAAGIACFALLLFAESVTALRAGAVAFLGCAALVSAYRLTLPADYPESAWYLGTPHAVLLCAAAVALAVGSAGPLAGRGALLRTLAGGVAGGALVLASPSTRASLLVGGGFFGGNAWLSTIDEFRPWFTELRTAWLDALILAPFVAAMVFAAQAWRTRSSPRLVLAMFAIVYGVGAVSSKRLACIAIPLFAVAGALSVQTALDRSSRRLAAVLAGLVVVAPLVATLVYLPGTNAPESTRTQAMIRAALALRTLPAEGRVLAPWDRGHLINFYSGRPAVIDNFGGTGRPRLFDEAIAILLTTNDDRLARFCRDNGIAYIVLDHPIEQLAAYAKMAGDDPAAYVSPQLRPTPRAEQTFWWRAYFGGERAKLAGVRQPESVNGFRLVWTDGMDVAYGFGMRGNAAQIWEPVEK